MYLMKAKMMCCCINNLVQAQDNNANGIHAKAYLLWDFYVLCESKFVRINECDMRDCIWNDLIFDAC